MGSFNKALNHAGRSLAKSTLSGSALGLRTAGGVTVAAGKGEIVAGAASLDPAMVAAGVGTFVLGKTENKAARALRRLKRRI